MPHTIYVTDRTTEDVKRWKQLLSKGWSAMTDSERSEWLGELSVSPSAAKGMYTHNDLNRVEGGVAYIIEELNALGHYVPPMTVKTNWTYMDTITISDMERYFSNIATLRGVVGVYPHTPDTPTIYDKLTYEIANDIEKILADIEEITLRGLRFQHYSGEVYSGEV